MLKAIKTQMIRLWNDESGAAALEYGLIAAGIAVVVGTALSTGGISDSITTIFGNIASALSTAAG